MGLKLNKVQSVVAITSILLVIFAIITFIVVSVDLKDETFYGSELPAPWNYTANATAQCLLGINNIHLNDVYPSVSLGYGAVINGEFIQNSDTLCDYTYTVAGLGIFFAMGALVAAVIPGAPGLALVFLFSALQAVNWGIAADVLMDSARDASNVWGWFTLPGKSSRDAIWGMAWAQFSLACIQWLLSVAGFMLGAKRGGRSEQVDEGGKVPVVADQSWPAGGGLVQGPQAADQPYGAMSKV